MRGNRSSLALAVLVGCTHIASDGTGVGSGIPPAELESSGAADSGAVADATDAGTGSTSTDGGVDGSESGAGVSDSGGDTSTGSAPDVSECSELGGVEALFEWVNDQRGSYGGEPPYLAHERWKGIPWAGEYHSNFTFSIRFEWDDELAALAQAQADALAAGAAPSGTEVAGQNGQNRPHWIDGINTEQWRIVAAEYPGDFESMAGFGSYKPWALDISNGSARMSLHYHDFGGDGPAIHRVGIGAATRGADDGCVVWWVLQFGP